MRTFNILLVSTPIAWILNTMLYAVILGIYLNLQAIQNNPTANFATTNLINITTQLVGGFPLLINAVIASAIWQRIQRIKNTKNLYFVNKFTIGYAYTFVLIHALINYTNGDIQIFKANLFSLTFLPIIYVLGSIFLKTEKHE